MNFPNEIIFWDILPSIRKQLVLELKKTDLRQNQIAQILDITPSAVSQYIKNKRGDFKFSKSFKKKIEQSANKISKNPSIVFEQINFLIKDFKDSGELCPICEKRNNFKCTHKKVNHC